MAGFAAGFAAAVFVDVECVLVAVDLAGFGACFVDAVAAMADEPVARNAAASSVAIVLFIEGPPLCRISPCRVAAGVIP
jgi:hypothetical protein